MVSPIQAVLLWAVVFIAVIYGLRWRGYLEDQIGGAPPLIVLFRTQLGVAFLDRLSNKAERFWDGWGIAGVVAALVGMVIGIGFVALGAVSTLLQPEQGLQDPSNALVIPGVSDFLPLAAAAEIILGLLIALVVHEGGHGLMCRVGDIDIDSTGLLFGLGIPIGAFVEPDEESQGAASRLNRIRMASAGIMNNLAITVIAFVLLVGPMTALIAPAAGAPVGGVFPNSAADDAEIERGDRIVAVNDEEVATAQEAQQAITQAESGEVTLTLSNGDTVALERGLLVTEASERIDAISVGSTITAVNGQQVTTQAEYQSALSQTTGDTVSVTVVQDGEETTVDVPAGVPAQASENGALAAAGAPTGTTVTITEINGEAVYTASQLSETLDGADAGQTVEVTALVAGEEQTYTATLNDEGQLGVAAQDGIASLSVSDTGIRYYPAQQFLNILSFGGGDFSLFGRFLVFIFLPAASQAGLFNFAGFTPEVQEFYTVAAPDPIVGLWFFAANILFWTAWININLAVFNCIPTYGLDGGHILRDGVGEVLERLGGSPDGTLHAVITHGIRASLVIGLFTMLFGGLIFSAL